jgi:hypothetical protein
LSEVAKCGQNERNFEKVESKKGLHQIWGFLVLEDAWIMKVGTLEFSG